MHGLEPVGNGKRKRKNGLRKENMNWKLSDEIDRFVFPKLSCKLILKPTRLKSVKSRLLGRKDP